VEEVESDAEVVEDLGNDQMDTTEPELIPNKKKIKSNRCRKKY